MQYLIDKTMEELINDKQVIGMPEKDGKAMAKRKRMYGLIYRLRKKGYDIDTKGKTIRMNEIQTTEISKRTIRRMTFNQIIKLEAEYGFVLQAIIDVA